MADGRDTTNQCFPLGHSNAKSNTVENNVVTMTTVGPDEVVAALLDVGGHVIAHQPEPDESDSHDFFSSKTPFAMRAAVIAVGQPA